MARVVRKRPVDVLTHTVDFTDWMPVGGSITSVATKVVGEDDSALLVDKVTITGPEVSVQLAAGTSRSIYQVYVTATFAEAT